MSENNPVTLKSIQLINFMCHNNLLIEFNRKISCIVGSNGSGKSAVMIALGLLFGLRATAMRGSSYKEYIKTGEEYSVIKIKYKNFLIEKKITPENSRIKITENNGKVKKTGEEISSILEELRINLKNPISFLTQDESKRILKGNSKNFYSFFKSGTDIENIEEIQIKNINTLEKVRKTLKEVENKEKIKNQVLETVRKRLEEFEKREKTEEKINRLRIQREWSIVSAAEKRRAEKEKKRERLFNEYSKNSEKKEKIEAQVFEIRKRIEKKREENLKKWSEQKKIEEEVKKNKRRKEEIVKELEYYKYEIEQKEKKKQRIEQILGEPKKEIKVNLEQTEKELIDKKKTLEIRKAQIDLTVNRVREELLQLMAVKNKKRDILKVYDNGPLKFYGNSIERVLEEINRKQLEVIGPLGLFIEVRDKKWSRAVEAALGSTVYGFIVHSAEVKVQLEQILKEKGVKKYQIYLSSKSQSNILMKAKRVSESIKRGDKISIVLEEIENNNVTVVEQLIVLLGIEKIGLAEGREESYKILQKKTGFDYILTPSPDRIQYVGTSLSDMRCSVRDKALLVSKEGKVELSKEIEKLTQKIERCSKRIIELTEESSSLVRELEKIVLQLIRVQEEIERDKNLRGDELELERKQCMEELEGLKTQKESVEETYKEVVQRINSVKNIEVFKNTEEETEAAEIQKLRIKEDEIELESRKIRKEIEELDTYLEELHKECMILRDRALELSDQQVLLVDTEPEKVEEEIINLEAKVYACSLDESESEAELKKKKEELESELLILSTVISENTEEIEEIEKGIAERVKKREELTVELAESAQKSFTELMERREYSGYLEFNHEIEELNIRVKVQEDSKGNKNSLSGGERSFSSICFILAMWPLISSPIRILDEFDVFMDGLNRKAALNLIFERAREINSQIIIITPLGVSTYPKDICEVISLKGPRKSME